MLFKITILYVLFVEIAIAKEIGEACEPNDKTSQGSCKLVIDCEVAVRAIRLFYKHPFKRCGFNQIMEVVCCPTSDYILPAKSTATPAIRTTTPLSVKNLGGGEPKRIADRECEKIVNSTVPPVDLHIIGGSNTSLGEFPHMVALGYNVEEGTEFLCGGSLVSDRFILTAAHCTKTMKPIFVRLGVIKLADKNFNEKTDVLIQTINIHPNYMHGPKYHDLALLKLEKPVVFNNNLYPICLYTSTNDPQTPLIVTGWGKTSLIEDILSNTLLKANVTVVSTAECQKAYAPTRQLKNGITEQQICAGDPRGLRDTCQGDSGGPLQKLSPTDGYYRLVGVTSFGRGCGSPVPGVYTRVAQYLDWIESVVWQY